LSSALFAAGIPTALGGTLGQKVGATHIETSLTTPEAPELYEFLALAAADDAQAAILEVSSAALIGERVHGMRFDGAILTGLSHDHLDLHGSSEEYLLAKLRLFAMLPANTFAVLPGDDPVFRRFREATRARVITFGQSAACDWRISDHHPALSSAVFTLEGPSFREQIEINRPAQWDARNLAASVAAAEALGASAEYAARGAALCPPIPGRWEAIDEGQPFSAVVDYAHTPDALERALVQMRALVKGRVLVVFGCGGDRDRDKRAPMGAIAGRLADIVIITDDNPRREDPENIANAVTNALKSTPADWTRIPDRAEAIRCAVGRAREGDGLLVAGKGHEATQEIAGELLAFDDREQLASAIRLAGARR